MSLSREWDAFKLKGHTRCPCVHSSVVQVTFSPRNVSFETVWDPRLPSPLYSAPRLSTFAQFKPEEPWIAILCQKQTERETRMGTMCLRSLVVGSSTTWNVASSNISLALKMETFLKRWNTKERSEKTEKIRETDRHQIEDAPIFTEFIFVICFQHILDFSLKKLVTESAISDGNQRENFDMSELTLLITVWPRPKVPRCNWLKMERKGASCSPHLPHLGMNLNFPPRSERKVRSRSP